MARDALNTVYTAEGLPRIVTAPAWATISSLTEQASPAVNDWTRIEQASDGSFKKVQLKNLPVTKLVASDGSPDPAWYTDAAGELYGATGLTIKATKQVAKANTMYYDAHFEAYATLAGGGYPTIGLHRSGAIGTALYAEAYRADQDLRVRDSNGRDWPISRHHGVGVYRNANLAVSGWTTITWTTNYLNDGTSFPVYWDTSTALYGYAQGWYLVHAYGLITSTSTSSVGGIRFGYNGIFGGGTGSMEQDRTTGAAWTGNTYCPSLTRQVYLTYGQYVQVQMYVNVSGTLAANDCAFAMLYLGE